MNRSKSITVITIAIMIGIIIGLVITSNLDMMKLGNATEREKVSEAAVSPASGGQVTLGDLEKTSRTFVDVVKRVSPTVVTITTKQKVTVRNPLQQFFGEDFFRRFYGQQPPDEQDYVRQGLGSGVIVSADGYILTNNHVVDEADELIAIIDGEELEAKVVGTDPKTDLALIKVDKNNLPYINRGDSDALQVGEIVLAIGSPFSSRLENTVTQGIVSAKGRRGLQIGGSGEGPLDYQDFIQTDAAINPGNSGGALVNLRGELVGINTAIVGQANVGIGFAIPVNLARWVMDQLIESGHVVRGYLGVVIGTPDKNLAKAFGLKDARGALVHTVSKDTPADKAGIEEGDIIIELDGKPIADHLELMNLVAQYSPGSEVKVKLIRKGKEKLVTVKLTERPDEEPTIASSRTPERSNTLGIQVEEYTDELKRRLGYEENYGVVVSDVKRSSPAYEQGLRNGDLILEHGVEREKIETPRQFYDILKNAKPGDVLLFRVRNKRGAFFVTFEVPEEK